MRHFCDFQTLCTALLLRRLLSTTLESGTFLCNSKVGLQNFRFSMKAKSIFKKVSTKQLSVLYLKQKSRLYRGLSV